MKTLYAAMLTGGPYVYDDYADFAANVGTLLSAPLIKKNMAGRDILPMSTGRTVLPGQSAQIAGRFQTEHKIGRFVISNAGTNQGAADWLVHDLKINDVPQLPQAESVTGRRFTTNQDDDRACFVLSQPVSLVVVTVTYEGLNERGCPFFGALIGAPAR